MELLRIFVVALIFAAVTVFSYCALNSKGVSWETMVNVVTGENSEEGTSDALPETANAGTSAEETEAIPELPSEGSPFAASGTTATDPLDCLPGLDEGDTQPAATAQTVPAVAQAASAAPAQASSANTAASAASMNTTPALVSAAPQVGNAADAQGAASSAPTASTQSGTSAAAAVSAVESSTLPELPTLDEGTTSQNTLGAQSTAGESAALPAPADPFGSDSPMVQSSPAQVSAQASASASAQVTPATPAPAAVPMVPVVSPSPVEEPAVSATVAVPADEQQAITAYLATASEKIQNGEALEVLRALSPYSGVSRFSKEDTDKLVNILVQAATQVIYSQKSFLEPPYIVQAGDTLESIAQQYQIPAEFISRVNGLAANATLQPGQSLKVLRGPFTAMVYLDRYELVLTLNGLFAGRFWIGVGGDMTVFDGDFYYRQLLRQGGDPNSTQFAFEFVPDRAMISPGAVQANSLILHPTNDPNVIGKTSPHGNILLSMTDMLSLNALLGTNSHLVLRSHLPATSAISPATSTAQVTAPATAPIAAPTPAPASAPIAASTSVPETAPISTPAAVSAPDPIASPVNESLGSQASLPGYAEPAPTSTPLVDELPAELP